MDAETSPNPLSDGSGNARYANNMHCLWHITSPASRTVLLAFSAFALQARAPDGYCRDWVRMFDGPSTASPVVGTYCGDGSDMPREFSSTGRALTVEFYTDNRVVGMGFSATYALGAVPE